MFIVVYVQIDSRSVLNPLSFLPPVIRSKITILFLLLREIQFDDQSSPNGLEEV